MKAAFWVAASPAVGGGHVVRSVSIANALAAAGVSCTFFVNPEAVSSAPLLARSGHRLVVTAPGVAEAIAKARLEDRFDWLVVDNYGISAPEETPWRPYARKIAVVDDLADRPHDCDLLLDTTPLRQACDYNRLVPPGTELLIGPGFVPLRAEFAEHRAAALRRRENTHMPNRVLVSFGLVDPGAISAEAMAHLPSAFPTLAFDVILGTQSESYARIVAMDLPNVTLHIDPSSMSRLMIDTDIAIGAGGSTAWERACLGLPAIALVLADNQRDIATGLAQAGALMAFERSRTDWPEIADALRALLAIQKWRHCSYAAANVCDGLGAQRIVQAMIKLNTTS